MGYAQPVWIQDLQAASWFVAVVVGLVTACLAITNFRNSIKERRLDLLWKRANAANEFVHEVHLNKDSLGAIEILDWLYFGRGSSDSPAKECKFQYADILETLAKWDSQEHDDDEHQILKCFDWFMYYVDRMEQNIRDGLFSFDNVKYIFLPYYERINSNRDIFNNFASGRKYLLAPKFWERFGDSGTWK
jgi:hypothetical protein